MDKFFYRLTVQTVIKGILTAVIGLLSTALLYTLFTSILQPISASFDYWLQTVAALVVTVVTCFMIIEVKDSYTAMDTYSASVGHFWSERAYKGKKVPFWSVELMMLPLLLLAIVLAYLFYHSHAATLAGYATVYSEKEISASVAQNLFYDNIVHFAKLILAVFFFAQWWHVRKFAKMGQCRKCKAAFALGYHRSGGTQTTNSSKITKKGKTKVVGASYQVTEEDGEEVERIKIADIYDTVYNHYKTDTRTTYSTTVCHCAFCGELCEKTDVWSNSTTTKLP